MRNPEFLGKFDHRGKTYTYTSKMVDLGDEGPAENRVHIRESGQRGRTKYRYQECASTTTIIGWFKDMLDNIEEMKACEDSDTDEVEIQPEG